MKNSSLHRFIPLPINENFASLSSVSPRKLNRLSTQTTIYNEDCDDNSPLSRFMLCTHFNIRLQTHIYNFLERPSGIFCFLYHFTVFSVIIGCLVYSSILTVYVEQSDSLLFWVESILFLLFLIEHIVRIWSSGCRMKYQGYHGRFLFMRKSMCIVDLCVILGYAIL
ncbi:unnamed protein product, partial [Rotaria magnacalcarata]